VIPLTEPSEIINVSLTSPGERATSSAAGTPTCNLPKAVCRLHGCRDSWPSADFPAAAITPNEEQQ